MPQAGAETFDFYSPSKAKAGKSPTTSLRFRPSLSKRNLLAANDPSPGMGAKAHCRLLPTWSKERSLRRMNAQALFRRRPYLTQVVATALVATLFVLAINTAHYRGMANALGMFLPPVAIAIVLNPTWDRRAFMMMALIGVSILTVMVVGVNLTSYG